MSWPTRLEAAAVCAGIVLAAAAGCSRTSEPAASSPTPATVVSPSSEALAPVALPDLSAVAVPVQQQVRARYEALARVNDDPGVPAADRAARYAELGHVLLAATFFDEATLCYRHAESLQPGEAKWPYLRGHASLRKGDQDAAARAFARALELQPSYVPAMVWLGDVYLDLGRTDLARTSFAGALARQPDSAAALFGAGRVALAQGAYADAVRYLEQTLRIDPRASAVRYPLAMAYRGAGERAKADAQLQTRGTAAPDLPDPLLQQSEVVLDSAVSYESLGMQALRQQDWAAALQAFRRGLEVAPGDVSLRYWMATAMIASRDAAGAEREFRAITREHPDFAKAHFSLGAVLDQRGLRAEALSEYEAAVRAAPVMPEARLRLADTLRAMGRMAPAFDQYEEAVRLDPSVTDAWRGGAQALIALGKRDEARAWIARARQVHPGLLIPDP